MIIGHSLQVMCGCIAGKKDMNSPTQHNWWKDISVDEVVKFGVKFQKFIKENNLHEDQLFNCDETGLNFCMLPSKSLAAKIEPWAPGYKSKER